MSGNTNITKQICQEIQKISQRNPKHFVKKSKRNKNEKSKKLQKNQEEIHKSITYYVIHYNIYAEILI